MFKTFKCKRVNKQYVMSINGYCKEFLFLPLSVQGGEVTRDRQRKRERKQTKTTGHNCHQFTGGIATVHVLYCRPTLHFIECPIDTKQYCNIIPSLYNAKSLKSKNTLRRDSITDYVNGNVKIPYTDRDSNPRDFWNEKVQGYKWVPIKVLRYKINSPKLKIGEPFGVY